jgi:hypothetical protein
MFDPETYNSVEKDTIAEYVDIGDTFIDKYQRVASEAKVNSFIRAGFDPDALSTIVLSLRNPGDPYAGLYAIVDGNHRIQICRKLGIARIFARVCIDKTYEEEALLYTKLNARHRLSALDIFRARIEQQEAQALEMQQILKPFGMKIGYSQDHGAVTCVWSMDNLYVELGAKGYTEVVALIHGVWRQDRRAWIGAMVDGVKQFWIRYYLEADQKRLVEKLSTIRPEDILREAGYGRVQKGAISTRIGKVIVSTYNNGLRRSRLSDWMDHPGRGYDGKGGRAGIPNKPKDQKP